MFLETLALKDNLGNPWFSNSSYGNLSSTHVKSLYFDRSVVQKWEKTINALEKGIIYRNCKKNMAKMGYGKSRESKGLIRETKDSIIWALNPEVIEPLIMSFISDKAVSILRKHALAYALTTAIYRIFIKVIYLRRKS